MAETEDAGIHASVRVREPGTMPTVLERLTVPRVPGASETFPFAACSSLLMRMCSRRRGVSRRRLQLIRRTRRLLLLRRMGTRRTIARAPGWLIFVAGRRRRGHRFPLLRRHQRGHPRRRRRVREPRLLRRRRDRSCAERLALFSPRGRRRRFASSKRKHRNGSGELASRRRRRTRHLMLAPSCPRPRREVRWARTAPLGRRRRRETRSASWSSAAGSNRN
jgi:hypothetical protein